MCWFIFTYVIGILSHFDRPLFSRSTCRTSEANQWRMQRTSTHVDTQSQSWSEPENAIYGCHSPAANHNESRGYNACQDPHRTRKRSNSNRVVVRHFGLSNSPASTALTREVRENPSKPQPMIGHLLSFFVDAA